MNMRVATPLPLLSCASPCCPSRLFPLISITHACTRTHQRSIGSRHADIPQRVAPVIFSASTKKKEKRTHTHTPTVALLDQSRASPLSLFPFSNLPISLLSFSLSVPLYFFFHFVLLAVLEARVYQSATVVRRLCLSFFSSLFSFPPCCWALCALAAFLFLTFPPLDSPPPPFALFH